MDDPGGITEVRSISERVYFVISTTRLPEKTASPVGQIAMKVFYTIFEVMKNYFALR